MPVTHRLLFATITLASIVGLSACNQAIARPFEGPGYDRELGVTLEGVGDTVVVGLTNADLVSGDGRSLFQERADAVMNDIANHDGFVGYSVRQTLDFGEVWTMSVWRDEDAMWTFVASPAHQKAIDDAFDTMERSTFATVTIPVEDVPLSWERALEFLEDQGTNY